MQQHEFTMDMAWKDLCNRKAVASQRYDEALASGDTERISAAGEDLQRAIEAVAAREDQLREQ